MTQVAVRSGNPSLMQKPSGGPCEHPYSPSTTAAPKQTTPRRAAAIATCCERRRRPSRGPRFKYASPPRHIAASAVQPYQGMTENPQSAPGTKPYIIVIVMRTLSVCFGVVRATRAHARSAKKGDEEPWSCLRFPIPSSDASQRAPELDQNAVRYRVVVRFSALWCVSLRYAAFTLSRKKRDKLAFVNSCLSLRREKSWVRIPPCPPGIPGDCRFDLLPDRRCTAIGPAFLPRTRTQRRCLHTPVGSRRSRRQRSQSLSSQFRRRGWRQCRCY